MIKKCFAFTVLTSLVALPSPSFGQESITLSFYRVPEKIACGPKGYDNRENAGNARSCPVEWNPDLFKRMQSYLSVIRENIVVPPSNIRWNAAEYQNIHLYADVAESRPLSEKDSVLVVAKWSDRRVRDFSLIRSFSPNAPKRDPFRLPPKPYLTRFYHEPLENLDPDLGIKWAIKSNSSEYVVTFRR
jgi:hypothetical protein